MYDQIIVKICVLGESSVGKTSFLSQYCYSTFDQTVKPTVGCDFTTKIKLINGLTVRLQLWDIAGQERYTSMSKLYVRGALGVMIFCSSDLKNTVDQTLKWKKVVDEYCDPIDGIKIPCLLVQNKLDLIQNKTDLQDFQKKSYLQKFAKDSGFFKVEMVSAKENLNVADAVQKLLDQIIRLGFLGRAKQQNKGAKLAAQKESSKKEKKSCSC